MAISIKDITKPVTPEEILELFLKIATDMGLPVTAWQTGEPARAILEIIAQTLSDIWNDNILPVLAMPLLDYCEDVFLTLVALMIFGTDRYGATFAQGPGVVENRGASFYTFAPGDIRILGDNNKTYTNRTGGSLPQWPGTGDYPTLDLQFIAEDEGADSSLAAGVLTLLSGQIDVFVTQTTAWIGQDEEQDENLRVRCRSAAAANGTGGPKLAYDYVLRSTKRPDGTTIPATRIKVIPPPGDGTLTIYVASPSGEIIPDDVAILKAAAVEKAEPLCTTVDVISAENVVVDITATAYIYKGTAATADVISAAKSRLASFFSRASIGGFKKTAFQTFGFVYKNELAGIISESLSAVYSCDVSGSDIPIGFNGVPVLGTVNIDVRQLEA